MISADMTSQWSRLVLLATELTFAVLFLRAFVGYLHRRDPLQRSVTFVFTPCMVLFCLDVARRLGAGPLPAWLGVITLTMLLAQPYLTVRLAGRLRDLPRDLDSSGVLFL